MRAAWRPDEAWVRYYVPVHGRWSLDPARATLVELQAALRDRAHLAAEPGTAELRERMLKCVERADFEALYRRVVAESDRPRQAATPLPMPPDTGIRRTPMALGALKTSLDLLPREVVAALAVSLASDPARRAELLVNIADAFSSRGDRGASAREFAARLFGDAGLELLHWMLQSARDASLSEQLAWCARR